jgi:F0F1-type ATP synthase delta subunit
VVLIILFLISNKIINHFIGCSQLGAQAITDIANQASERHQSQQTLRELKELYKKQDDLTSVEIDKAN